MARQLLPGETHGPRALRGPSKPHLYGLPGLRPFEKEQCRKGTLLAVRSMEIASRFKAQRKKWILENPYPLRDDEPSVFNLDEARELLNDTDLDINEGAATTLIRSDQCRDGADCCNQRASWEPNPYCKVSAGSVTTLQNGGSITTTRGSRHPTRHSDAKDIRASPVLGRYRRTNGTQTCQRHARNTQLSRRKRILGHSTNVLWQRSSVILNLDRLHLLRAVVLLLSRDSLLVLSQRRPSQRQTPIATPMVSTREGPSSLTRSEASLIHRLKSSGSSKTPTPLVVCGTLLGPSAEYPRLVRPAE